MASSDTQWGAARHAATRLTLVGALTALLVERVGACPFAQSQQRTLAADATSTEVAEPPVVHAAAADVRCIVTFRGKQLRFQACRTGLKAGVSVYWNINGSDIETVFTGKPEKGGYVAWGWGSTKMVGASATVAYLDSASGIVVIDDYYLASEDTEGVRVNTKQGITEKQAEVSADGSLIGRFVRPMGSDIQNGTTGAIWAVGPPVRGANNLGEHGSKADGKFDLSQALSGASDSSSSGSDLSIIILAHMYMMGVAWLVLAPLGIFAMRYLKKYNPMTFQLHRGLMVTVLLTVIVGYIFGVMQGLPDGMTETAHLVVGTIVLLCTIAQTVGGIFRPDKGTPKRRTFNLAHWWTGRAAVFLAVANTYIGLKVVDADVKWFVVVTFLTVAWMALLITFSVFLSSNFPIEDNDFTPLPGGNEDTFNDIEETSDITNHHLPDVSKEYSAENESAVQEVCVDSGAGRRRF